mgnify:CR=1 FL=1
MNKAQKHLNSLFDDLKESTKIYEEHMWWDTISEDDERYEYLSDFIHSQIEKEKEEKPEFTFYLDAYKNSKEIEIAIKKANHRDAILMGKGYEKIENDYLRLDFPYENYVVAKDGTHIINTYNNRIKLPSENKNEYMKYKLYNSKDKKMDNLYVHRLVAQLYVEKGYEEQTEVDHIDRDRKNNNYTNLRYVTRKENLQNRY